MFYIKQSSRPSYHQGFYSPQRGGIPAHPESWRGLVGVWFPALGITGNKVFDQSAFKNHGILTNMDPATDWVISDNPRLPGYALDFAGDDDVIIIGNPAILNNLGPVTIMVWAYPRTLANIRGFVAKDNTGNTGFRRFLYMQANGQLRFGSDWTGTNMVVSSATSVIETNVWQHFTSKWDGSLTAADVGLYKNAIALSHTVDIDGSGSIQSDATLSMVIGAIRTNEFFTDTQIASVLIYNRILANSEITDSYLDTMAMFELSRPVFRTPDVVAAAVDRWHPEIQKPFIEVPEVVSYH